MATTPAKALYDAANEAVLSLLSNPTSEAHFNGRGYTYQDLQKIMAIRDALKLEAQGEGSLPVVAGTAKFGVTQLQVFNPAAFIR